MWLVALSPSQNGTAVGKEYSKQAYFTIQGSGLTNLLLVR